MPAAYSTTLGRFDASDATQIIGALTASAAEVGHGSTRNDQVAAWQGQIDVLFATKQFLLLKCPRSADWTLLFEYEVPRRYCRPDAILLADELIFVIEFKVGASTFDAGARWQVESYGRDLRDFHAESAGRSIIPVLVATRFEGPVCTPADAAGGSIPVLCAGGAHLGSALWEAYVQWHRSDAIPLDAARWNQSAYKPTLNILESAQELFAAHDVREIAHCCAANLTETTDRLIHAITLSSREGRRTICFVTGVPGSGKTLAGLHAVHNPVLRRGGRPAGVFLSGNRPLVRVVRAALVRAAMRRGEKKAEAERRSKTYIQDVHRFLAGEDYEHVVVFDEAQRAWDAERSVRKKRAAMSEAELMLARMAARPQWCVIVALIGGGQEIHKGEAGLAEWGRALTKSPAHWDIWASPAVIGNATSAPEFRLFEDQPPPNVSFHAEPSLHLRVNVRTFRAQAISDWVRFVLQGDSESARTQIEKITDFPIALTRDIGVARKWLRRYCLPDRRSGLVASSGALRLRPYGIEVSAGFRQGLNYEHWFLNGRDDFRASTSLEVALSEFELQGLELDYVGVCWGNDFWYSHDDQRWMFQRLDRAKLSSVPTHRKKTVCGRSLRVPVLDREYIRNKYRVLLTRAREGLVIWVPRGDSSDPTISPETFDGTAGFLKAAGLREVAADNF